MQVVDAHVHIFPEEIVRHRDRFTARDRWFEELYASERARLATAEDLVESMDGAGIDISIACGFPWRDEGLCRFHNDYLRASAQSHPDRIAWLAIVSPRAAEAAYDAGVALAAGASGLGELNADAQGFDLQNPAELTDIVSVCVERDRPIMLHVSEPVGHSYPGKGESTPARLLSTLEAFPALRIVAAHWGGGLPFYELMPEVKAATANLAYDSAASTYLYDHSVFETVIDLVGVNRVLFATDFPVLKQAPLLNKVRARPGISASALSAVLGENAKRIYGLEEAIA
ncbi:MAG: amidohydrolase family protein [Thermomicrobiales bacterium]